MANIKVKKIGQPEIMVAQTIIGRDCVTFSLPKSILAHVNIGGDKSFFCITNGVIQISGDIPIAVMPAMTLTEDSFMPQVN
jgi:hypothetical protein